MDALYFDTPLKMQGSLAKSFFKDHECSFGSWIKGEKILKDLQATDSRNNKINYFDFERDSWIEMSSKEWFAKSAFERTNTLMKTASSIETSLELFAQIEFFMRGIPTKDTKKTVKQIAEYFTYYSNLGNILFDEKRKIKDTCTIIFKNVSPLLVLARVAQCIASGRCVRLVVENNVCSLATLFAELINSSGIPSSMFYVYASKKLTDKVLQQIQVQNGISAYSVGTTMVVYESSDIDSAVETVINAAWSHRGMLPWALNKILIQECVYERFIQKLSQNLKNFKWDLPEEFKPDDDTKELMTKLDNILEKATQQGIKYLKMHKDFNSNEKQTLFKPVVLLDNVSPYFWNDLPKGMPIVTTQSFRTTKEALSLMNNNTPYALSLWCDNIAIINEVGLASNVRSVWVNSFGIIKCDVAFKIENQFLGGSEGYYCNFDFEEEQSKRVLNVTIDAKNRKNKNTVQESDITKIMKLQATWATYKNHKKAFCFLKIASFMESKMDDWISLLNTKLGFDKLTSKQIMDKAIAYLKFAATSCEDFKDECIVNSDKTMCLKIREPLGIILIDDMFEDIDRFIHGVVGATLLGNGVLYKTNCKVTLQACKVFSDNGLPVLPVTENSSLEQIKYEMVKGVWKIGYGKNSCELNIRNNAYTYSNIECSVYDMNTLKLELSNIKTMWSTFGEMFAN